MPFDISIDLQLKIAVGIFICAVVVAIWGWQKFQRDSTQHVVVRPKITADQIAQMHALWKNLPADAQLRVRERMTAQSLQRHIWHKIDCCETQLTVSFTLLEKCQRYLDGVPDDSARRLLVEVNIARDQCLVLLRTMQNFPTLIEALGPRLEVETNSVLPDEGDLLEISSGGRPHPASRAQAHASRHT